jgi:hypothetical protein
MSSNTDALMSKWTDDVLNQLSREMDPFADEAAASIFNFIGDDREKFKKYMINLARFDHFEPPKPTGLVALQPPALARYLDYNEHFSLTNEEKHLINRASLFFEKHGPAIIMVLACRSLLKQYASTNTSELLGRTKLLTQYPHRRIIETMQFVMDVMEPDWFSKEKSWTDFKGGSPAVHSIQKLRLIHAMIRWRVLNGKLDQWDPEKLEQPINQEDMIMANYTFSLEVIEGLKALGIHVSIEERDDFFKAWQVLGRLLGIRYPDGLMPSTYEEAWALQDRLYEKNFQDFNPHAKDLADALIDWLVKILPMTDRRSILDLIAEINGPENVKIIEHHLKVDFNASDPGDKGSGLLSWAIRKFKGASNTAKRTFVQELFNHMVNAFLGMERQGKERRFRIIDGFEKTWELTPERNYMPITRKGLLWKMVKAFFHTIWHRLLRGLGLRKSAK